MVIRITLLFHNMKQTSITIKQSIIICKPRELVWDYTQDHIRRSQWDPAVTKAEILQHEPKRIIRLEAIGKTTLTCHHDLHERPGKSAVVAKEVNSPLIHSADGRWTYDKIGRGTIWSQTNTIVFKPHVLNSILIPIYKAYLRRQIRKGMKQARQEMENVSV